MKPLSLFDQIEKVEPEEAKKYLKKRWKKKVEVDPDLKDWYKLIDEVYGGESEK